MSPTSHRLTGLVLFASLAFGCGPRLPEQLRFKGTDLAKTAEWKLEGVQSVVFVPEGESLRDSSLQVGILTSTEHKTARELNVWIMKQYRLARVSREFESVSADTACKVGHTKIPNRDFVAVHLCREAPGFALCVEADARITAEMRNPSGDMQTHWDRVCTVQWDTYGAELETLARRLIAQR